MPQPRLTGAVKMSRAMNNKEIADLLRSVAAAYELKGSGSNNRFRIIAYENAAAAIENTTSSLRDLWKDRKLSEVSGIGASIEQYLNELFKTGSVKHFEETLRSLPSQMFDLLKIPGIGAKTALKLVVQLKIGHKDPIRDLAGAGRTGRIRQLPGFGEDSERKIMRSIAELKSRGGRMLLPVASSIAREIGEWLMKIPAVKRADPLGSLRRQMATVGDVDMAVASDDPEAVIKHFTRYPNKARIVEAGDRTATILLPSGVQVDLMVQPERAYGALLQHFTGSKQHNIVLREHALKKGMSLSEYGIKIDGKIKTFRTEEDFYEALGLEFIPPELRENTGEIEASLRKQLPRLVELKDIKGDFHLHSNFPIKTSHDEGSASMEEMVEMASGLGYQYLGFSEHNPAQSKVSKKQCIELVKRKRENVDKINYSLARKKNNGIIKAFNSLEVDILPGGGLAIPEEALEYLDYIIVSVHSSFRQTKSEQTKRVLSALDYPQVKIFGHPTARRLNTREGIELEWDEIFDFCLKNNKVLEVNSWYDRLDLPDTLVHEAVKRGVKLVINTDSHARHQMEIIGFGVAVARRGWATKDDVLNTWDWTKIKKWFTL